MWHALYIENMTKSISRECRHHKHLAKIIIKSNSRLSISRIILRVTSIATLCVIKHWSPFQ